MRNLCVSKKIYWKQFFKNLNRFNNNNNNIFDGFVALRSLFKSAFVASFTVTIRMYGRCNLCGLITPYANIGKVETIKRNRNYCSGIDKTADLFKIENNKVIHNRG